MRQRPDSVLLLEKSAALLRRERPVGAVNKPVRKHNILKRTAMRGFYLLRKIMRVPFGLAYYGSAVFSAMGLVFGLLMLFVVLWDGLRGVYTGLQTLIYIGLIAICVLCFAGLCSISFRALMKVVNAPIGSFLNPERPEINEVLSEREILVRASMPNNDAQKEILLRATVNAPDAAPEMLLRATAYPNSNALSQTPDAKDEIPIAHG